MWQYILLGILIPIAVLVCIVLPRYQQESFMYLDNYFEKRKRRKLTKNILDIRGK